MRDIFPKQSYPEYVEIDQLYMSVNRIESKLAELNSMLTSLRMTLRNADHLHPSPPTHSSDTDVHLSPEDKQLLILLGRGHTIHTISRSLHWSRSTVERHIMSLCDRCGVINRNQLLVWATLHGYCDIDQSDQMDDAESDTQNVKLLSRW